MNQIKAYAMLMPLGMLAACGETQTHEERQPTPAASSELPKDGASEAMAPSQPTSIGSANRIDDGIPDLTPPQLTPEAERGVQGARNILLSFARAIELEEYGQAWGLLSPADQRKWSKTAFAAIFADLGKTTVAVPDGTIEGAAGSSYYAAPITVTGSDKNDRSIRITGKAVLRRVNDVDGASPSALRWHFETLKLDRAH